MRRTHGAFEDCQRQVEVGVLTPVFDDSAAMPHRRAVSTEQCADLGQVQAENDVRQVHRDLSRESDFRPASTRGNEFIRRHREYRADALLQNAADGQKLNMLCLICD